MEIATILILGSILIGLAVFMGLYKVGKQNMAKVFGVCAVLLVAGLYMGGYIGGGDTLSITDSFGGGTTPADSGDTTDSGDSTLTGYTIESLTMQTKEKFSNSRTSASGTVRIFEVGTDPSDPNAVAIDTVTISSGVGTSTSKFVKCGQKYRVVFDGGSTYYDKDFGDVAFSCSELNPNTAQLFYDVGEILKVGTIDDPLDETSTSGIINGQSNVNASGTNELDTVATADNPIIYDESVGDGVWYIEPTFSVSTANTASKDLVVCFVLSKWDTSNPADGNEMSSVTAQAISGQDWGLPSDVTNYWKNEGCMMLGSEVKAGTSGKTRFTFNVVEANLDANDDWGMVIDDLGGWFEKDVMGDDNKATYESIDFDAQA